MDQEISTAALGPSIDDFHIALKADLEKLALDAVKCEEGNGGWAAAIMAAGNPRNIHIGDEDDLEKAVRETFRLMGNFHSDHAHHDEDDLEKRVRDTVWLIRTALGPSIDDFHIALQAALQTALDAVKYEAGNGGWAAAIMASGNPYNIDIGDEDVLEKTVRDALRLMGNLRSDSAHHDLTVARQLHHLYSIYFTGQLHLWRGCDRKAIINSLARMNNRIESNSLWPDGSWISNFHKPNPTWLSDDESNSLVGDLDYVVEYKKMLHRLGYAPVNAPTKAALDKLWHDLYNIEQPEYSKLEASASTNMSRVLPISSSDKYAVVSYVHCADGTKPPASWTAEVDSVLSGLVELGVIPKKVVWFDKLASRQYKDSQKWWGAAATMQFLFNPIIVILPRMSEQSLFAPHVGPSIWGSGAAIDGMYTNFLDHAHSCKECQSSFSLRWALKQDHVIPAASLRTWPRVEHALGASGLGIFTSETTYSALVACLTCAFAMFGALLKNDPTLQHELYSDATQVPWTYLKEDGSMLIGGWVIVSCSDWHYSSNEVLSMACLKDMASCMMELHSLFCQLHIPRLVALGRKGSQNTSGALVYDTVIRLPEASGLFHPEGGEDVDVPMLARFNSNGTYRLDLSENDKLDEHTVVGVYHHWALLEIQNNQPKEEISTDSFVKARKKAVSTLVYTKAAQAPCYSWSDKLVAAILLSLPNLFAEAVTFWNDRSDMLTRLSSLILSRAGCISELDECDREIEWEPNTLIVALAISQFQKHHLHRLVPRPPGIEFSRDRRVSVQPFVGAEDSQSKQFAAFFLGHIPPRSLDALSFHTKANTSLPQVKEWVHKTLQDGALCNMNVVVIRSMQPAGENTGDIKHCWHCQKHRRVGDQKHSANAGGGIVIDILKLQDFVQDMLDDGNTDESVVWGLGSFDPLNLAALSDEDACFGVEPDTVAVLLEHRLAPQAGENSAGTNSSTILHAHGLAHFCILGNEGTSKCNACHAIIIQEKYHGNAIAIWTIVPMVGYKDRFNSIPGFVGIG